MKFPDLETMVMYGIYTVKDLLKYSQKKLVKRNVKTLNECEYCAFVYPGPICTNCNDIKNNSLV